MPQIRYNEYEQKPRNIVMQVIGFIVGFVVFGVSLVLGAFLLAALLGFALIAAVVVMVRVWWLRRQMEHGAAGDYIETEYEVLQTRDREDR